jgi:hypothetical protein
VHVDLTGGEQAKQHRCRICRWQYGLCFDAPLDLFVQALEAIAGLPPDSADEAVASPPLA